MKMTSIKGIFVAGIVAVTAMAGTANAQVAPPATPALPPALQLQIKAALTGTDQQVLQRMRTLVGANQGFAVEIAAQMTRLRPQLAAQFAGAAAGVVPPAQLGALYQAVAAGNPGAAAQIANRIRQSVPPGTNLATLNASVLAGLKPNTPVGFRGPGRKLPPVVLPDVVPAS